MFWRGTGTAAVPTAPTYVSATHKITIPAVTGVVYTIGDETVAAGDVVITEDTVVDADPAVGYYFNSNIVSTWDYKF